MTSQPAVDKTTFALNTGARMPAVGLGTWQGSFGPGDEVRLRGSIMHALKSGYRLLDTAQGYGVERQVGDAVRSSGIPREDITVVTKFFAEEGVSALEQLDKSVKELGLEYVDVMLLHWPNVGKKGGEGHYGRREKPSFVDVWVDMQSIVGPQCKAIGVSNFSQTTLNELLADPRVTVVPAINQVELHVLNPNPALVPYCKAKNIHVMSWSTLGGAPNVVSSDNPILKDKLFLDLGEKYGVSAGVISLSWCVQRGVTTVPKSSTPSRIEENIRLVKLSDEDMKTIDQAHETLGKNRIANKIGLGRTEAKGQKDQLLFGWTYEDFGWEDSNGKWLV